MAQCHWSAHGKHHRHFLNACTGVSLIWILLSQIPQMPMSSPGLTDLGWMHDGGGGRVKRGCDFKLLLIEIHIFTYVYFIIYTAESKIHISSGPCNLCIYIYIYSGEGNGNPLQYSCLENPMDRGTWWTTIHGVAQSRAQLKWLSSSSILYISMIYIIDMQSILCYVLYTYNSKYSTVYMYHINWYTHIYILPILKKYMAMWSHC